MTKITGAVLVGALMFSLPAPPSATARQPSALPDPVIAVIEAGGANVLHRDFALAPGQKLTFPTGMPRPKWISLPNSGTFSERLDSATSGELGDLEPGQLYWIKGTRLGIFVPNDSGPINIFEDRFHATGTVSSAIGLKHGTNPSALAIFIPASTDHAWQWLAEQSWIDAISTSYFTGFDSGAGDRATCPEQQAMSKISADQRLIFSSSGNVEQIGMAHTPSGSPFTYQVGGVDDEGRTYIPGPDNTGQSVTPTRPYETGDRFDFPSADSESLDGSMAFGGTSGATPSTAGRAVELLHVARSLLGSRFSGVRDGALAVAAPGRALPDRGPLRDGRLERDEFVDLLHHSAVPAEPPSPIRYLIEGYGALNDDAVKLAKEILAGRAQEPERPEEDSMHAQVESIRPTFFPDNRCG